MRNMSFMLTPEQITNRTKTVTRRIGWATLQPGTLVRAVRKSQGLKKGEKVEALAVLRIVSVRREPLDALMLDLEYGIADVEREGFGKDHFRVHGSPAAFVDFFVATHHCDPADTVTRIEFEYVDEHGAGEPAK